MNQYYAITTENSLEHHGILGQKWGVRRYQNEDGSYTQAGLKRYNQSKEKYEYDKNVYKSVKKLSKQSGLTVSKNVINEAKSNMKSSKAKMNKDYNHLKLDKLADKGKARYANGETITGHGNVTSLLASAGTVAVGARYLASKGIINKKVANVIGIGSAASVGASFVKRWLVDMPRDRQLRAYYSHTSNY